jgi:DNA replication protein DnaC
MPEPEKVDFKKLLDETISESLAMTKPETPSEQQQNQGSSPKAWSLWRASQITDRHREFKAENSDSAEWSDQWCKLSQALGQGTIAVIIGNRGAGKTQMAVCAIRHCCKKEKSALYTKALDFFLDVRGTYKKDNTISEREIIERYCEPNLLVIDAIENRSDSEFENLLLNYLIDIRYDRMLDTVLIGNYTAEEFAASMGPSIVDRIHECGIKIVCNWRSFRRR